MSLPDVRGIRNIIDAISDYAVTSAHACFEEQRTGIYHAPSLSSWDAFMWFELIQDWELTDFLVSNNDKAKKLVRSLQCCLQWYGQREIDEINSRVKILSMIN